MKKSLILVIMLSMLLQGFSSYAAPLDDYIKRAADEGLIVGDENGDLCPDKPATRAEFVKITVDFLKLVGGKNVFVDVSEKDWYCEAFSAASFFGIFYGFEDKTARPKENIKLEDAVAILGRYYKCDKHRGKYSKVSDYAEPYYGFAYENGFFDDWGYFTNPKDYVTRKELVSLLYMYQSLNLVSGCFLDDYPKQSREGEFGKLTAEIKLMQSSDIYYSLCESGTRNYNWAKFVSDAEAGKDYVLRVSGTIGKSYDLYVKAVSKKDNHTQIKVLKGLTAFTYIKGQGTKEEPYEIYDSTHLSQIQTQAEKYFILKNDIDLGNNWTPIKDFSGVLDGNGYKITATARSNDADNTALFAKLQGTVKNLTVQVNFEGGKNVGAIAAQNCGNIISCTVSGSISAKTNNAGGICGENSGSIENCLSALDYVKAGSFAGGVSGQNQGEIKNCISVTETVVSDMYAGGISGINQKGIISGCVAGNAAVYNTMTYNSGKITTNKKDGVLRNNYSLDTMTSNAANTEDSPLGQNGLAVPVESLTDLNFYYGIGFDKALWEKKNEILIPCPKNAKAPDLAEGKTPFLPKKIQNSDDFFAISRNNRAYYVLKNDIALTLPWKMLEWEEGFLGCLDGDGHTVYNLKLKGENALFSKISGGTVKNINFSNVVAMPNEDSGIIAVCNFGYITNCNVSGKITTKKGENIGGIASENSGRIDNCTAKLTIVTENNNSVVGGICAYNNGVAENSEYVGNIEAKGDSTVVGGICGYDTSGYLSQCFAEVEIEANNKSGYIGGVFGISQGSQIYKCAAKGRAKISGGAIYAGGIGAMAEEASIYSGLSQLDIEAKSDSLYLGGVLGYLSASVMQNTYSVGRLTSDSKNGFLGGICGGADNGFVMQNVSLSPEIKSNTVANAIIGENVECEASDNYSCSETRINSVKLQSKPENGNIRSISVLKGMEFYTKSLISGGALGWDEDIWTERKGYSFPILTNVSGMERLEAVKYK